jgi:hypothetical protein
MNKELLIASVKPMAWSFIPLLDPSAAKVP